MTVATISRSPLTRKTTMDETIEEGLNFLRSGCKTYNADCFPVTLGKRIRVTKESNLKNSDKRIRKSPERKMKYEEDIECSEPPKKKRRTSKSPSTKRKSTSPKRTTTKSSPRKVRSATPKSSSKSSSISSPKKSTTTKTSTIYCPPNFNNGSIDFKDLDEFKTRTMKSTGTDERITEIVFSFDTTGSMGRAIAEARKNIIEITNRLFDTVHGLKIGIIAHGDYCDSKNAIFQVKQLSDDKEELIKWINSSTNGMGGDAPENYEQVLEYCANEMNWTEGSHRVLVLIGDSVPHEPKETLQQMKSYNIENPREIDWRIEADNCWKNGIKIYGVQANAGSEYIKYFYESIAKRTCGTHLELKDFPTVTDMLMMVCFREADRMAFDAFRDEVEREGRMDDARKEMFDTVSK